MVTYLKLPIKMALEGREGEELDVGGGGRVQGLFQIHELADRSLRFKLVLLNYVGCVGRRRGGVKKKGKAEPACPPPPPPPQPPLDSVNKLICH